MVIFPNYYARVINGVRTGTLTLQITLKINPVNDAPIANDKTVSTNETRFISLDLP